MIRSRLFLYALLVITLLAQAICFHLARGDSNAWAGVPPAPTPNAARMLSLGDDQAYFRLMALRLQHMGDTGGAVTPLAAYDYARLKDWFFLADSLDATSEHVPVLAGYYFGWSRDPADIAHVADYLASRAEADPAKNWRWLYHAIYLTRHRADDERAALYLARRLGRLADREPSIPVSAHQMEGLVLADQGDYAAACRIFVDLLNSDLDLPMQEIAFMHWFLETRIRPQSADGVIDCLSLLRGEQAP